ncbi:MAG TPA: hypothetical protein VF401_01360 [Candidatus Saccharimonadales bacterium]
MSGTPETKTEPTNPYQALHAAIHDAFDKHPEWTISDKSVEEEGRLIREEATQPDTANTLHALQKFIAGDAQEEAARESKQTPGRGYLISGALENVEHLQGISSIRTKDGLRDNIIHLQRLKPSIAQNRGDWSVIPTDPQNGVERYAQSTEMLTLIDENGDVTNIVMLPSEDLGTPCAQVFARRVNVEQLGWTSEAQLTKTPDELRDLREQIEGEYQASIGVFPNPGYWTELPQNSIPELTGMIKNLRPIEY